MGEATDCGYGEWSIPRRAMRSARPAASLARWPSIAVSGQSAYIAGTDLANFTNHAVRRNAVAVWTIGGRSIGRPAGTFRYFYPQLLADRKGRLHLIWAEAASRSAPITGAGWLDMGWPGHEFTALWTAVYDPARGWSLPRKLLTGSGLKWNSLARVEGDDARDQGMVAIAAEEVGGQRAHGAVVHLQNDSLIAFSVSMSSIPAYTSITRRGSDVFLGFIASAQDRLPDENSVFLQRSRDGGTTWDREVLVSRSGRAAALELRVHATPDGHIHLVWRQTSDTTSSQVIRHLASRDGGRTWSAPDDLPAPPATSNLHTVVDACGTLHLVFDRADLRTGASRLEYATWNGHWSSIQELFPKLAAWDFTFHRAPDGRLRIGLTGRPADAAHLAPVTTFDAERAMR
jgi:hypothetical protein